MVRYLVAIIIVTAVVSTVVVSVHVSRWRDTVTTPMQLHSLADDLREFAQDLTEAAQGDTP